MGIKHKCMNKCPKSVYEKSVIQEEKNDTYKEPMHAWRTIWEYIKVMFKAKITFAWWTVGYQVRQMIPLIIEQWEILPASECNCQMRSYKRSMKGKLIWGIKPVGTEANSWSSASGHPRELLSPFCPFMTSIRCMHKNYSVCRCDLLPNKLVNLQSFPLFISEL